MAKYDGENLLADMKTLLVANLNTAIAAVEAEKIAQGLPETDVSPIASGSYVEQTLAIEALNAYPHLFYGIEEMQATGVGPATKRLYKLFCEVLMIDNGQDSLGHNRISRYARAMQDVFEANYDKFPCGGKIIVETVRPIAFKLEQDSSEEVKVGGVSISMALA